MRRGGEGGGDQQRLAGDAGAVELVFQSLVDDALMRRVHIDQHQAGVVFGQDVDAVQLRDRAAERPVVRRLGFGRGFDGGGCGLPQRAQFFNAQRMSGLCKFDSCLRLSGKRLQLKRLECW